MILFDFLYLFALVITLPLWIKVLLKKEYRSLLKYRLLPDIKYSKSKRIWLHAVSMGEVRSLKYLVSQLKEIFPNKEIVLSVSTPAGYKCAKEEYSGISVINAPVDFSFTIRLFIRKINPEILILNELEIWPNWVRISYKKHIPMILINGRISEKAFMSYSKWLFFFRRFFKKIQLFLVQASIYNERFQHLGIEKEKIIVCGNIKADEAFNRLENLPPNPDIFNYLGITPQGKTIVTLASSHQPDEEVVIPAIREHDPRFFFIIIPRHLNRVPDVETLLQKNEVEFSTWSKCTDKTSRKGNVLIFDKMGYLFEVLKITDIVFMGGTLDSKTGGHNLYEPAVQGKYIIGGPFFNNFPDIGSDLVKRGVYHIVQNPGEFTSRLVQYDSLEMDSIREEAIKAVSVRKGSIQCIINEIQKIIPKNNL